MKNLYIFGTLYFDFFKLVDAINKVKPTWNIVGFVDTNKKPRENMPFSYPFLEGRETIKKLARDNNNYILFNKTRNVKAAQLLKLLGCNIATLIHPDIDINHVTIGKGCIIPEGCVIGGFAKIGNFVTIRLKSLISHDVTIEDNVFIGPGASIGGNAVLKKRCFIGQSAVIMGGKVIGEGSVVGAGAVVTKDVAPGNIVVGVPAKPMKCVGNEKTYY